MDRSLTTRPEGYEEFLQSPRIAASVALSKEITARRPLPWSFLSDGVVKGLLQLLQRIIRRWGDVGGQAANPQGRGSFEKFYPQTYPQETDSCDSLQRLAAPAENVNR
jgi:hypothetical protein